MKRKEGVRITTTLATKYLTTTDQNEKQKSAKILAQPLMIMPIMPARGYWLRLAVYSMVSCCRYAASWSSRKDTKSVFKFPLSVLTAVIANTVNLAEPISIVCAYSYTGGEGGRYERGLLAV